jgi:hypothetical protein|nr:MAG TPA: hypothetical protein [Bacteriophage sp.]
MWGELLSVITNRDYPLESMQENVAGYVDPDNGWDLSLINPWFTEHGYEFVGYLDLFSENEPSGVYVNVDGCVWRCRTNAHDNSIYWYWQSDDEGLSIDDMRYLHGYAHQFIWDNDTKTCDIIHIAE